MLSRWFGSTSTIPLSEVNDTVFTDVESSSIRAHLGKPVRFLLKQWPSRRELIYIFNRNKEVPESGEQVQRAIC